jgi:PAS domain S-box-containing protein
MMGALLAASQFFAHRDWLIMLGKSRLSERTLADVIAHAPIGIARASTNLKVVAANPSLGMLLGEPPEAMTGSAIVNYVLPEVQPEVRRRLNALASGDAEIVESEIPMIRTDGNRAWVHLTSTAVKKPTGEVDYLLAMMKDETDRHEAEDVARTNLAELEHLSRMKSEFLQSISHEFRTALVGINGFSELMKVSTDIDPNEVREFARDISSGAERLSRMVTEFLELDHVETGPASVLVGPVDMNAIIRREIEQVRNETDGLTFTSTLDPQLALMLGDEGKLSHLVTVLLRNAVRYSPDGGRIIVATRTHVGRLELTVTDQGVGVRADFDNPLFSGDEIYANNPIRRVVGTGLGLGIARQIVAVHGGRIWMDRLDGVGSEAHVSFPVDMTAPRDSKSEPRASAKAS